MTGSFFFPDNTVLINFAIIREFKLLESLLGGRGNWTEAVHAECENSDRTGLYGDLGHIFSFMPGPLMLDVRQRQDAMALRNELAEPMDPPHRHLGEAQTITVLTSSHVGSRFITDDGEAFDRATSEGIAVIRTESLLALAVRVGKIDQGLAESHVETLYRARRGMRLDRFRRALGDP